MLLKEYQVLDSDMVVSWLLHLTLELVVLVQALIGDITCMLHFTLGLSLHPGVGMGTGKCNVEGNPAVD